ELSGVFDKLHLELEDRGHEMVLPERAKETHRYQEIRDALALDVPRLNTGDANDGYPRTHPRADPPRPTQYRPYVDRRRRDPCPRLQADVLQLRRYSRA